MAREHWGSRIGVILAVAGSAVGLGNFLRFPGQAAQNGGGAFMIPYFISLLILGIPLCWAEWNMGRYGGLRGFHSCPGVYNAIWRSPVSKFLGGLGLLIPLVIYMYYVVLEAWCLGYAYHYAVGSLPLLNETGGIVTHVEPYSGFFARFVGLADDGVIFQRGQGLLLLLVLVTFVLNFILIYRGVTKGIEKFCKFAMPVMVLCALCVLARVLTLGTPDASRPDQNVLSGLGFMWNPDMEKLKEFKTWLAASSQIFFSISVGFGIIINYASYVRREDDIVLSSLTAASTNEFFEVCLAGLITIPAGVIFLGAAVGEQGTFGLGFTSLPVVFAHMPGGRFFGFVWFLMLFLAAITSSLSMLQPGIAFLEEGFALPRKASVTFLGLLGLIGSAFVIYFSKSLLALDTFDFWVGTALIFVVAMIQTFTYSWIFGSRQGWAAAIKQPGQYIRSTAARYANAWRQEQAHRGAHMRIPRLFTFVLKYVSPLYLLVIFVGWALTSVPDRWQAIQDVPVVKYSVLFLGGVLLFLLMMVALAGGRWERTIASRGGIDAEEAS